MKPLPVIVSIVQDGDHIHYLQESHLDAWWNSLAPHEKAALFESELEGPQPRVEP